MGAGATATLVVAITFFLQCQCKPAPPHRISSPDGEMSGAESRTSYTTYNYTLAGGQYLPLYITSAIGNAYVVANPNDSSVQLTVTCNPIVYCYPSYYYCFSTYTICNIHVYDFTTTNWTQFCHENASMTVAPGKSIHLFSFYETWANCNISAATTSTSSVSTETSTTTTTTASSTSSHSSTTPTTTTTTAATTCDCGRPNGASASASRIVGGAEASPHQFPYLVYLDIDGQQCSAALISNRDLVTAAHCVDGQTSVTAYFNEHSISTNETGEFSVTSSNFTIHEGYDETTLHNDIAIIHLDQPLNLTARNLSVICMPDANEDVDNINVTVAGWGTLQFQGSVSDTLQFVVVPTVNLTECAEAIANVSFGGTVNITSSQLCAGEANKDSCQGDSGGPLIKERDDRDFLVGIVSYGIGCGDTPGVYTRVSAYRNWIYENSRSTPCSP